jgi:hypothetical protein
MRTLVETRCDGLPENDTSFQKTVVDITDLKPEEKTAKMAEMVDSVAMTQSAQMGKAVLEGQKVEQLEVPTIRYFKHICTHDEGSGRGACQCVEVDENGEEI